MAHLMRFFEVIRGARIAAPTKLLPVMKIPLRVASTRQKTFRCAPEGVFTPPKQGKKVRADNFYCRPSLEGQGNF